MTAFTPFRLLALTWLCVLLAGCGRFGFRNGETTASSEAAFAADAVSLLLQHRFDDLQQRLSPELQTPETIDRLQAMAALFPGTPITTHPIVVSESSVTNAGKRTVDLTMEYGFGTKWLLVNFVQQEADGRRLITGLHVTPIPDSLERLNKFTLHGKTELQYDALIVAILTISISLYAFVLCLRTKSLKRKWVWQIGTLVGIAGFGVNWTTGAYFFSLLTVHLPPAGASASHYGPWTVFITLPIGAIAFLLVRGRLKRISRPNRSLKSTGSGSAGPNLL